MYDYVPIDEINDIIKHGKCLINHFSCTNQQTRSSPICPKQV